MCRGCPDPSEPLGSGGDAPGLEARRCFVRPLCPSPSVARVVPARGSRVTRPTDGACSSRVPTTTDELRVPCHGASLPKDVVAAAFVLVVVRRVVDLGLLFVTRWTLGRMVSGEAWSLASRGVEVMARPGPLATGAVMRLRSGSRIPSRFGICVARVR
jgi:hypothetical protein